LLPLPDVGVSPYGLDILVIRNIQAIWIRSSQHPLVVDSVKSNKGVTAVSNERPKLGARIVSMTNVIHQALIAHTKLENNSLMRIPTFKSVLNINTNNLYWGRVKDSFNLLNPGINR
jgi:hypothetical protein